MPRNQHVIDRILDAREPESDHSLRRKALERATKGKVPKTLTPHEWEQWYAEHGVPDSHRRASASTGPGTARAWWRRWLRALGGR